MSVHVFINLLSVLKITLHFICKMGKDLKQKEWICSIFKHKKWHPYSLKCQK